MAYAILRHGYTDRTRVFFGWGGNRSGWQLSQQSPDDRVITGMICKPSIIGETPWQNSKIDTMIAQNATSATTAPNQCLNYRAITTASYFLMRLILLTHQFFADTNPYIHRSRIIRTNIILLTPFFKRLLLLLGIFVAGIRIIHKRRHISRIF